MLNISETARKQLHDSLDGAHRTDVSDKCFRIVPASQEQFLTLRLDKPKPDDTIFEYEGRSVLALPKTLEGICADRRLHVNAEGRLVMN